MRLTLRTLLAYLDNVLEPEDAGDLKQKIQQSEMATQLVERIHGSMTRVRLDAPSLLGTGRSDDPNEIAEYLDSTLGPEAESEVEKICLKSEKHLGEVAACHQVLTMVLGEPAEVPPGTRRRVYSVGRDGPVTIPIRPLADDSRAPSSRFRPEDAEPQMEPTATPEGMRTRIDGPARWRDEADVATPRSSSRGRGILLAGVLGVAATVLFFLARGPLDKAPKQDSEIADARGDRENSSGDSPRSDLPSAVPEMDPEVSPPDPPRPIVDLAEMTEGEERVAAGDTVSAGEAPDPLPDAEIGTGVIATPTATEASDERPVDVPDMPLQQPELTRAPTSGDEGPAPDPAVATTANPATLESESSLPAVDAIPGDSPTPSDTLTIDPATRESNETEFALKGGDSPPAVPPPDTTTADAPASSPSSAMLVSPDQVVARFHDESNSWVRVAPQANLLETNGVEELVVLPNYRPQIEWNSQVQLIFSDASRLRVHQDPQKPIEIDYGRLLIDFEGGNPTRIPLKLGSRSGLLELPGERTRVAIEVSHRLDVGQDPGAEGSTHLVVLMTCLGSEGAEIVWTEESPRTIALAQTLVLVDHSPGFLAASTADTKWTRPISGQDLVVVAAKDLEKSLPVDQTLEKTLRDRSVHPRVEMKSLVARSLMHLGKFDVALKSLNDEHQKGIWQEMVGALVPLMAADPQVVTTVQEAARGVVGERGGELVRLLWGYSPTQFAAEGSAELVRYLEDTDLAFRVLAFQNLRQITGNQQAYSYKPDAPKRLRAKYAKTWQQKAKDQKLKYVNLPEPLPSPP